MDTYRGCAFQCSFCFARQRGGNAPEPVILPANPTLIGRAFERALGNRGHQLGLVGQFLQHRTPIHFGGMSDPFQPIELRYGVTKSALEVLARYHYPTVISTRGTMVSTPPYLNLIREIGPVLVQFSFSSSRDDTARLLEPKANPPSELLRSMEKLTAKGIAVSCRWQPYVLETSEAPSEFVRRISSTGCSHVAFEHLKVPLERNGSLWGEMIQRLGYDVYERYKALGAVQDGRELVLPVLQKLPMVVDAASEVHRLGMTFGAADNEFQYLSDSACCCSGADLLPGFENFFKHQIGYAIRKCRGKAISYAAIEHEWAPEGSVDRFLNSHSRIGFRNGVEGTIRDHIKTRWNQPGASGSPSSFFGIVASRRAVRGMESYRWDSKDLAKVEGESSYRARQG
jgi:DNA repair photolyase